MSSLVNYFADNGSNFVCLFRFCAIMYGFAYKNLCEIDREGLNIKLSALTSLSLKEFNCIESTVFMAFNANLNVSEDYFSNKVAAFEKAAAANAATPDQDLCSQSQGSFASDQLFTTDDQNASDSADTDSVEDQSPATNS